MQSFLRKIHRWLAPIVFIQLFLWLISGIFFSWNNFNRSLREEPNEILPMKIDKTDFSSIKEKSESSFLDILQRLKTNKFPVANIQSISLGKLMDSVIIKIALKEGYKTYLFYVSNLEEIDGVTEEQALQIAQTRAGSKAVLKSKNIQENYDVFYASFYGELPVYKFKFDDSEKGELDCFVSPRTGEIIGGLNQKNRINRVMFSWFHIMEYSQTKDGRLWGYGLLMGFSILMLASLISGLPLYFKRMTK